MLGTRRYQSHVPGAKTEEFPFGRLLPLQLIEHKTEGRKNGNSETTGGRERDIQCNDLAA